MDIKKLLKATCLLQFALSLQADSTLQTQITNVNSSLLNAQSALQNLLAPQNTKSGTASSITYSFKNTSLLPCIVTTTLNYAQQPNMTYKDIANIGGTYTFGLDNNATQANINVHFVVSPIYQICDENNSYTITLVNGVMQIKQDANTANTKSVITNNSDFDVLINFRLDDKKDNQIILATSHRYALPADIDSMTIIPLIADYNITEDINSSSKAKNWTIISKNGNFTMQEA
ncbi:MAG: hypothetical protein ACXWL2_00780 [Candidatus Chromulinivorax sp.]